jgi:hypothetical protein
LDPLHYLVLLEQRPGAFEYAKPLRQWRQNWPVCYHLLLRRLREKWPEGRGVKEFVQESSTAWSIVGSKPNAHHCLISRTSPTWHWWETNLLI